MNEEKLSERFKQELVIRRYSLNSIKVYVCCMGSFIGKFAKYDLRKISYGMIEQYIHSLIYEKQISVSYQKQMLFAITLFYEVIYSRKINLYALYPKQKENKLPTYLPISVVRKMLEVTVNLKHKMVLSLLYGCGLRLSELINLKISDVDAVKMLILIRPLKGKKERRVMLSEKLLALFHRYHSMYRPQYWLFEGRSERQYSHRNIQNIVKMAALKAKIKESVTPYTLRHCFAMHLLENGIEIRYIQKLMGIESTEKYIRSIDTSCPSIKSPLDFL